MVSSSLSSHATRKEQLNTTEVKQQQHHHHQRKEDKAETKTKLNIESSVNNSSNSLTPTLSESNTATVTKKGVSKASATSATLSSSSNTTPITTETSEDKKNSTLDETKTPQLKYLYSSESSELSELSESEAETEKMNLDNEDFEIGLHGEPVSQLRKMAEETTRREIAEATEAIDKSNGLNNEDSISSKKEQSSKEGTPEINESPNSSDNQSKLSNIIKEEENKKKDTIADDQGEMSDPYEDKIGVLDVVIDTSSGSNNNNNNNNNKNNQDENENENEYENENENENENDNESENENKINDTSNKKITNNDSAVAITNGKRTFYDTTKDTENIEQQDNNANGNKKPKIKPELEEENKKIALQELEDIEIIFAQFKDKIYRDKLSTFEKEMEMCINGIHPALGPMYEKIDSYRQQRLELIRNKQKYAMLCIDRQTRAQRYAIHQQYLKDKADEKSKMLNEALTKWFDIVNDRKSMAMITPEYGYSVIKDKNEQIRQMKEVESELKTMGWIHEKYGFAVGEKIGESNSSSNVLTSLNNNTAISIGEDVQEDLIALGII